MNSKGEGDLMRISDVDITMYSREAQERGWDSFVRQGRGHVGGYITHSEARNRRAQEEGTGSIGTGGKSMREAVSQHHGGRKKMFLTNRRVVESKCTSVTSW